MPDLLGFPKVGIWGDAQEPFPEQWVQVGPRPTKSGTWGAGSPDPATSLLQARTGEQSHGSCQDWQDIE